MILNGTKVFIGVCSNCLIDKGISCGMIDRYFQLSNKEGLVTATISFDPDDISLNITIGQISQVVATQSKLTKTNKSRHEDTSIIYIHGINNVRYEIKGIWQKISQNPKLKKEISMEYCLGPIFSLDSPNYFFKDIYEVEEYYFPAKLRIIMAFDKFEGTLVYAMDKYKHQLIIQLKYERRYYFHIEYRDAFLPVILDTHCGVGKRATNEIFELTLWIDRTMVKAQCNNVAPTSVKNKKPVMLNTNYPTFQINSNSSQNRGYLWIGNHQMIDNVQPDNLQPQGCILLVEYNDRPLLMEMHGKNVSGRCHRSCNQNVCNDGQCLETYISKLVRCNCDRSIYNGPRCNQAQVQNNSVDGKVVVEKFLNQPFKLVFNLSNIATDNLVKLLDMQIKSSINQANKYDLNISWNSPFFIYEFQNQYKNIFLIGKYKYYVNHGQVDGCLMIVMKLESHNLQITFPRNPFIPEINIPHSIEEYEIEKFKLYKLFNVGQKISNVWNELKIIPSNSTEELRNLTRTQIPSNSTEEIRTQEKMMQCNNSIVIVSSILIICLLILLTIAVIIYKNKIFQSIGKKKRNLFHAEANMDSAMEPLIHTKTISTETSSQTLLEQKTRSTETSSQTLLEQTDGNISRRNIRNKNDAVKPKNNSRFQESNKNIQIYNKNKDPDQTYIIQKSGRSSQIKDKIINNNSNLHPDDILLWIDGNLVTSEQYIYNILNIDILEYCIAPEYPNKTFREKFLICCNPANIYNQQNLDIKEYPNCLKNNDHIMINNAVKESTILKLLVGCPNIPEYKGFNRFKFDSLLILQKHLEGELLSDAIKNVEDLNKDIKRIMKYCSDILTGLTAIHKKRVIHLNINPRNLFIENKSGKIYILDFSRSIILKNLYKSTNKIIDKLVYPAPEVQNESPCFDTKADIWSFGCTLVKILTKGLPYPNLKKYQRKKAIETFKTIKYPKEDMDPFFIDVIDKCTSADPSERPTAEQLLNMFKLDMERRDVSDITCHY